MKKKGPKSIPDFSSKRKEKPAPETDTGAKSRPPVTTRNVKPAATSSKAGRRGG